MKVYFTASLTGKAKFLENYKLIVGALESMGHKVVAKHILDVSAEEVRNEPMEERVKYLKYLNKWLGKCDVLVAETSYPSASVGFEISMSLGRSKPVVVLHATDVGYPPAMAGLEGENLLIEEYTLASLKKVLRRSLEMIRLLRDKRFTILFPSEIVEHLDKVAREGKARSEYIRDLIKKDMERKKRRRRK